MGILSFLHKDTREEKKKDNFRNDTTVLKVNTFIQSPTFKGYKRLKLATYGYEPITQGIDALKIPNPKYIPPKDKVNDFFDPTAHLSDVPEFIFDLKGKVIEIRQVQLNVFTDNNLCLQVFIENHHIGTFFVHDDYAKSVYDAFNSNMIEKVHIRFEQRFVVGQEKDKTIVETRYDSFLFIKYKE